LRERGAFVSGEAPQGYRGALPLFEKDSGSEKLAAMFAELCKHGRVAV
jgi:hypothetical protein